MKVKCIYIKNINKADVFFTLGKVYECSRSTKETEINIYDNTGFLWENKKIEGNIYKFEIIER